MLIYHQRKDIYHCIIRILSIVLTIDKEEIEFPKLRIIDFYLVFPHLIKEVRFPRVKGATALKNLAKNLDDPYELLPSPKRLFSEMGDYQIQAVHLLRSKRVLQEDEYGNISPGDYFSDSKILSVVNNSRFIGDDFFFNLINILAGIPLQGENGIKARTSLMEYRYDAT